MFSKGWAGLRVQAGFGWSCGKLLEGLQGGGAGLPQWVLSALLGPCSPVLGSSSWQNKHRDTAFCPSLAFQLGWRFLQESRHCPDMRVFDSELDETEKGGGKWKFLEGSREDSPCSHPGLVLLWVLGKFQVSLGQLWRHFRLSVCYTQLESKKHLHTRWNLCPVAVQGCFFINNKLCDSTPVPSLHKCVW